MRLLVVDSNERRSKNVTAELRKGGYTPDYLDTLGDAAEALSMTPYDGLVLDRLLPDGDGIPWLRSRRARGLLTPAIIIIGKGTVDDRIAALDAGADDCLPSPMDERELAARVRAILRRPQALTPTVLQAGNIALDTLSRELFIDGQVLLMPRRELCALESLLRRFGHIVTRETLETSLYGHADEWCANSLDVRISRVRRSLASAGADIGIHTIRGVGYILRRS